MDCEYWKDVVQQLRDPNKCYWASHVLSTGLIPPIDAEMSNLLVFAVNCVASDEIIEGAIYAYRNWSAQPDCDLILAQFDSNEILSIFLKIKSPDSNMKVGVLGVLEDNDRILAKQLAVLLNNSNESEDVLNAVRYALRES